MVRRERGRLCWHFGEGLGFLIFGRRSLLLWGGIFEFRIWPVWLFLDWLRFGLWRTFGLGGRLGLLLRPRSGCLLSRFIFFLGKSLRGLFFKLRLRRLIVTDWRARFPLHPTLLLLPFYKRFFYENERLFEIISLLCFWFPMRRTFLSPVLPTFRVVTPGSSKNNSISLFALREPRKFLTCFFHFPGPNPAKLVLAVFKAPRRKTSKKIQRTFLLAPS